jgi:CHAT domain-containing protein/Tfp pilus assembly protein PilF
MSKIRCWTVFVALTIATCLTVSIAANGQESRKVEQESTGGSELIRPGIVIDKFDDDYSGPKKAGMQEGDVLLSWSRGDAGGKLESPFDLSLVAAEQLDRGPVTFEGLRGTESRKWTVVKPYWGTTIRPNFSDAILATYRETLKMAEAGQPEASKRWKTLMDDPRSSRFPWLGSWLLVETARLLAQAQRWKESDEAYQQAILQFPSSGAAQARLLLDWGNQLLNRSELDRAQQYFEQAQGSLKDEASNLTAEALNCMGLIARQRGDLSSSQAFFSRVLKIVEQLEPGSLRVAEAYINFGLALHDSGELAESDKYWRRAVAIYEKQGPSGVGMAVVLTNLGDNARVRGDLDRAERYLRKAVAIEEKVDPGTTYHAGMLLSLAQALEDRGDNKAAEQCVRQSIAIQVKLAPGSSDEADGRESLGDIARNQKDFDAAQQAYLQALAIREKLAPQGLVTAESLQSLGDVAFARGDLTQSKSNYQRALAIRENLAPGSIDHANTLAGLARIARREGQLDKANTFYQQSLDALESQAARLGGSTDVRAGFRAKHEDYYREYIDLLISQNKPEEAFVVLERSRARALLETLAGAHIDIRKGAEPGLLEREHKLLADLKGKSDRRAALLTDQHDDAKTKAVEKEISDLTTEYQDVEAQIRSSSPVYAGLTQPRPLSLDQVQGQLLDRDTVLLEYSLGEERSHVFIVSANSIHVVDLPKRAVIEEDSQRVYHLLTERNRQIKDEKYAAKAARIARAESEYPMAVVRLSKTILSPVTKYLAGRRLLIVGDGALHYVPFAALPVPVPGKPSLPLAAEREIVTLPSASVLAALRRERASRKPGTKMVAVLADPVFDRGDTRVNTIAASSQNGATSSARAADDAPEGVGEESSSLVNLTRSASDVGWEQRNGEVYLPRLQFTREEANEITALAPAGQSFKALDFRASRATAVSSNLADYRIVHFATHALLNSDHPELSGLVLSLVDEQGRSQNGFVDLQDIYNMDLPAELVVLSGCETGLGKKVAGEGLVGLTRGFMYAGANRVMASLWKIDDRATAEFMRHFYTALLGQKMRPAAALRSAQLEMQNDKRWSSPYYWAAFQIQGEWK